MREEITQFGDPFDQALARVDMPPDVEAVGGVACLAEGIIGGRQCTLEGFVSHGEPHVYGTVDSLRMPGVSTFRCYQYPSRCPHPIQRRMAQIAKEVVVQAGLDQCCFNAEFFYDEEQGQIWILEINTRLSQSHCDLFAKVDGVSSQRAMLSLSQGRMPRMLHRQGEFNVAGKYFLRTTVDDGIVRSVPSDDDIAAVRERFPGTRIEIDAAVNRNVFIIAMDDFNKETMDGLREANRYDFHSLLPQEKVLKADSYDYDALLRDADEELRESTAERRRDRHVVGLPVDRAVARALGAVGPAWSDLRSVVALEHKFWSRLEQRAVANPHVPPFARSTPSRTTPWTRIEPGRGVPLLGQAREVGRLLPRLQDRGPEDFEQAMEKIRAEIAQFGDPFQRVMDRVDVPPTVAAARGPRLHRRGHHQRVAVHRRGLRLLARTCTCYGIIDSIREPGSSTFRGYQYPSQLPLPIRKNMMQISEDVVRQVGLDNSCFNVEFFYDEEEGHLWLLEVNTRLSQSHSDLFAKVDGASNQRAMLDVAQGRSPRMPLRKGEHGAAGKLYLRATEDGVVASVPDEADIRPVTERFPGTRINIDVEPGSAVVGAQRPGVLQLRARPRVRGRRRTTSSSTSGSTRSRACCRSSSSRERSEVTGSRRRGPAG
jgi:hypothetical protein